MKAPLSNYGDVGERHHNPTLCLLLSTIMLLIYFVSAMLPLLVPTFAFLVFYLRIIPTWNIQCLVTAIVLDFIIPLDDGYRPNPQRKSFFNRTTAEGAQDYFPARSIFLPQKQLRKDRAYLLAAWPHSVFGGGHHFCTMDFEHFSGSFVIYSGASVLLYIPFLRRFLTTLGFTSVTKQGLRRVLDVKKYGPTFPYNVVHVVIGGIEEMFYTPGSAKDYEQIIISKRKGFVKLALETGADLIPMYSFGANQVYYRIAGPKSLLCQLSRLLRVSITPWLGRWCMPMSVIGNRQPILTVTGPVLEVPKNAEVTKELVTKVHAEFCTSLRKLFDEYKKVYVEEMGADPSWLTKELRFEDE